MPFFLTKTTHHISIHSNSLHFIRNIHHFIPSFWFQNSFLKLTSSLQIKTLYTHNNKHHIHRFYKTHNIDPIILRHFYSHQLTWPIFFSNLPYSNNTSLTIFLLAYQYILPITLLTHAPTLSIRIILLRAILFTTDRRFTSVPPRPHTFTHLYTRNPHTWTIRRDISWSILNYNNWTLH